MHGDLDAFFGGGHETVHHDTHLQDAQDEAPFLVAGAADAAAQMFHFGANLTHIFHDTAHLSDAHHHEPDHQDNHADHEAQDLRGWQEVGSAAHTPHLHLLRHSEAQDSNGDGLSDAASKDLGIDAYATGAHRPIRVDWHDAAGHLHHSHGKDSDGWADDLERLSGTNPYSATSHPSLVEAHHFPAGSEENLPGTVDISPSSSPWLPL